MNSARTSWWWRPSRSVPAVLFALAVIGVVGFRVASKGGLAREMAEIRAKGLPTNPKELDAWYAAVPAAENAALKVLEAADAYVEAVKGSDPADVDWRAIPHTERLDGETMRFLEAHLENNAEALRLMHEAAMLKRSRYPIDLSLAPQVKFQHLVRLRGLVQLARWEATFKAEHGDSAGALDALKSGFAVAHTLASEPLVISELVRMACVGVELYGMERVMNVARFEAEQLRELKAIVGEALEDSRESLSRAFIGERAFANSARKLTFEEYEQAITMGGFVPNTSEVPEVLRKGAYYGLRVAGLEDRDQAFFMRSMGQIIGATELKDPDVFVKSEAMATEIEIELTGHPIAYKFSRLSLPAMLRVPKKEVILKARLRCLEMALELNGGGETMEESCQARMSWFRCSRIIRVILWMERD